MGTRVTIMGARLSYPHLYQPRSVNPGDPPKYGAAFLIPKNNPAIAMLQSAAQAEAGNNWGANPPPTLKALPLYDGDTDPKYAGDANTNGMMVLNTSAQDAPTVVDLNNQKIIDPSVLYAGCWVNVDVGIYTFDKPMSKGIAAGLNGVQFAADGDRIDGRPSAEDMFGPPTGAPPPIAGGVQPSAPPPATAGYPQQQHAPGGVQPGNAPPPPGAGFLS